ncbi:hypothetical protein G7009_22870 [Pseudomonas capeferrum]|uniref:NEL-type E3 ubiquitin ligase domain-containing protein n=1 Tax=Pseudomonas capeferrum TaxID=1495066 RepID=UPI0015E3CD29|nr:NEL-type E3 ubiquitin ligase domain-containing protein [Pseudomonas capeferrum]MBA1204563.1 hypothetical protein [Pseudomonas capeferrum]
MTLYRETLSLAAAAKLATATDDYIREILPAWLTNAQPQQINHLRDSFRTWRVTQNRLKAALAPLQPLTDFARDAFEKAMADTLSLSLDLDRVRWLEVRRRFSVSPGISLPIDEQVNIRWPALQRLLQNFHADASFYLGTGLVSADERETVHYSDAGRVASLCHQLDVGRQYQDHLAEVFNESTRTLLAQDLYQKLTLSVELATLKGELARKDLDLLQRMIKRLPLVHMDSTSVEVRGLTLLDCRIDGALVFELQGSWGAPGVGGNSQGITGVIIYLPGDPQRVFRRFDSWRAASIELGRRVRQPDYLQYISQQVGLKDRARFLATVRIRLGDARLDMQAASENMPADIFATLAARQVARIQADARFIAVPSSDANQAASQARMAALEGAGLVLLNLAGFFVPAINALLLSQLVVSTLEEVFEGVADWAQGHDHEALEHMLGVAETVAITAATAAGATLVARGFQSSVEVQQMAPVKLVSGSQRLYKYDLAAYRVALLVPGARLQDNGLYAMEGRYWWRNQDGFYEVQEVDGSWQLRHPQREAGYHPRLEHNGEQGWRLVHGRPLEWQGGRLLLGHLWPEAHGFSEARVASILKVAQVDEDQLRGLVVENRRLPVQLRDTLERFAVDARIEAFFQELAAQNGHPDASLYQWSVRHADLQALEPTEQREALLAAQATLRVDQMTHFSQLYLPQDELLALLQRDFPGLPDAYALEVLAQAGATQRQAMLERSRITLEVAEQARIALRTARVTRMLEGLYLRNAVSAETVELLFALLYRQAQWPRTVNLELREGNDAGRLLARLYPSDGGNDVQILVCRNGQFALYDQRGQALELDIEEPSGVLDLLLALLPEVHRQRLGWAGPAGVTKMRHDLQRWIPPTTGQLLNLVGWRQGAPRFNPGQRLADGRVGYLLSGRGGGATGAGRTLRDRIRILYPGFSGEEVERYLQITLEQAGSPHGNLLRQEEGYRALDRALHNWQRQVPQPSGAAMRVLIANQLRRGWRLMGDRVWDAHTREWSMRLSLDNIAVDSLPELPEGADFAHITELSVTNLGLRQLPANFLQCFPLLRLLDMSTNALRALPEQIAGMTFLHELRASANRIRITASTRRILERLTGLQVLDLDGNPLGDISLRLPQPSHICRLYMRDCSLRTVPEGLEHCGFLALADLRENRITALPEAILNAPARFHQALELAGNNLPVAVRERLNATHEMLLEQDTTQENARLMWLDGLEEAERTHRAKQWDAVRAEMGSDDFFQLLGELTQSSDFRLQRQDLTGRVWSMLDAVHRDATLRRELFSLAGNPRTCVDSVASCFSVLEVRLHVAQALHGSLPGQAQAIRLRVARRLFRLEQVEQVARADILARQQEGRDVDEIEVSLAYRTGLATRLELPGQPRTMQFRLIANVTETMLEDAVRAVEQAEASPALARFVSQRDFWIEYLQQTQAELFASTEQPFWEQLEALDEEEGLPEGEYLSRANTLASARQAAIDALVLRLTEETLAVQPAGEH